MKRSLPLLAFLVFFLAGCAAERLPSEDIEAPKLNARLIRILKDPDIRANSREKYEAMKELMKKVDFSFTRETKTINEFLAPQDAIIDFPESIDRRISFNYQYQDRYIRLTFFTYRNFVVRVDIIEK